MSLELILSIIGIINGTLAWYFSYKLYKKDKAKIDIQIFDSACVKANDKFNNYFVLLIAEITNNSSQPITINEIHLRKDNKFGSYLSVNDSEFTKEELNYIDDGIYMYKLEKYNKQLVYPKKINSYDSIHVLIPFKIHRKLVNEKALIEIKTSRKSFYKIFNFKNIKL